MNETKYKVKVVFTEPVLGTQPQKDVATEHITNKFEERVAGGTVVPTNQEGLPADEVETLAEMLEKGTTVFHRFDGSPIYYDYHIKALLKTSAGIQNGKPEMNGVKALKSKVNNLVFVYPRRIKLNIPDGSKAEYLERPIRAETMQGPRVSVIRSEMLPVGTWFECEIVVLDVFTENMIRGLLDYGKYAGFGQWRNGGYGRVSYTLTKCE